MASKRRKRRKSCRGKVRHAEEWEAAAEAKRLRAELGDRRYGWYKCRFCGGWHVGRRDKALLAMAAQAARNRAVDTS
jgi:hypothetical protein